MADKYEVFLLCTKTFHELMTKVHKILPKNHDIKAFYAPATGWGDDEVKSNEEAMRQCSHAVIIYFDMDDKFWTTVKNCLVNVRAHGEIKELPLKPDTVSDEDIRMKAGLSSIIKFKTVTTATSPETLAKDIANVVRKQASSVNGQSYTDGRKALRQMQIPEENIEIIHCDEDANFSKSLRRQLLQQKLSSSEEKSSEPEETTKKIAVVREAFFRAEKQSHLDAKIVVLRQRSNALLRKIYGLFPFLTASPIYDTADECSEETARRILKPEIEKKLEGQDDEWASMKDSDPETLEDLQPFYQDTFKGYLVYDKDKDLRLRIAVRKAASKDKRTSYERFILQSIALDCCVNFNGIHGVKTSDTISYWCLHYCEYSVEQYVREKDEAYETLKDVIDEISIVRGVANGLDYLHSRKKTITHINLSPAGIRILEKAGKADAKICDISSWPGLNEHAMEGFMAPEFTNPDVDVFSFGCFAYYVITKGEHPFSKPGSVSSELSEIQSRIDSKSETNFEALEDLVSKSMELKVEEDEIRRIGNPAAALELVKSTLGEGKKPSSCCITSHCYFFNPERQVDFHTKFGSCTPFYEEMDPKSANVRHWLLDELANHDEEVLGSTTLWGAKFKYLEAKGDFLKKCENRCKNYGNSVQSLSKFLRNQFCHELNDDKIEEFFQLTNEKKAVFLNRGFPRLLPVCWEISKKVPNLSVYGYHCKKHSAITSS